jgi:hypothetical protein
MTETIQQLKEDIAILQEKLNKLEELENQPKMNLHNEGEFSIVSYDNRTYYRLQLPAASFWYIETIDDYGGCALEMIENLKTKNELESQWLMNDVKKGKYDDVVDEHKSPVEEAYKDWWGQYPELETDSKYDDTRWKGFKAGFQAAYEEKVREDDYYDEVECDEKDNPKPMDEVVNRLIEKHKSQKLWNILSNKYDYISATCDDIVSAVEEWLPKEQSAAGSQNAYVECTVEGYNDCLNKIKSKFR